MPQNINTRGFISHLKEGVLRIFIAIKNPSPSAGFEPANVVFNGKHVSHYLTTADDKRRLFRLNGKAAFRCKWKEHILMNDLKIGVVVSSP
jgi:hypothetical protein